MNKSRRFPGITLAVGTLLLIAGSCYGLAVSPPVMIVRARSAALRAEEEMPAPLVVGAGELVGEG